jgi:hypothetical protein
MVEKRNKKEESMELVSIMVKNRIQIRTEAYHCSKIKIIIRENLQATTAQHPLKLCV